MAVMRTNATIEAFDEYTRSVPILASTPASPDGKQPAIAEWDLERFTKNPVALWGHDQKGVRLPIGYASNFEVGPFGLRMRVHFASERANPLAEQIWNCIREKVIRAVSVGYEIIGPHKARLLEVSFVPIGLDENAGTLDLTPDAAPTEGRTDAEGMVEAEKMLDALREFLKGMPRSDPPEPDETQLDDATLKRKISDAARVLSRHRSRLSKLAAEAMKAAAAPPEEQRTDAADHFDVARLDAADLSKFPDTQAGGKVIPARLSRIGVLKYLQPDGTYRRELRLPEEVFKADSLRTLEHAHVVDFVNHRSMVNTETFRRANLGVVANVRREGNYLVGDLRIDDADAIDAIANDERRDISCGYRCRLDWTPGEFEGEPYDCIQRDIKYNHAALCPPNRGRAGPDVALRLDEGESFNGGVAHVDVAHDTEGDAPIMTTAQIAKHLIRLDGKDFEKGSDEHIAKIYDLHKVETDRLDSTIADVKTKLLAETQRADKAEGERDGLKSQVEQLRTDAAEEKTKAEKLAEEKAKAEKGYVRARRKLERATLRYFGGPDDEEDEDEEKAKKSKKGFPPGKDESEEEKAKKGKRGFPPGKEGDEEEEKTDALDDDRLDSMSDRELMLFGIRKVDPKFNDQGKSDDYVRARFDSAIEHVKSNRSIHGVVNGVHRARTEDVTRSDADDEKAMAEARRKRDEAARDAWKTPPANLK